jgi:hypothetical protein
MFTDRYVRESRSVSIIALRLVLWRKWREEHVGPGFLREVKEAPRKRPNITRRPRISKASLTMDYRITIYW